MGEMKDVGTELYRLRFDVCPPRLAVSTVYVVTTTIRATAPFCELCVCGRTCVCVCVDVCACTTVYVGFFCDSEEKPSTIAGAVCGTLLPVLLVGPGQSGEGDEE